MFRFNDSLNLALLKKNQISWFAKVSALSKLKFNGSLKLALLASPDLTVTCFHEVRVLARQILQYDFHLTSVVTGQLCT
jgi:hypothetical protein